MKGTEMKLTPVSLFWMRRQKTVGAIWRQEDIEQSRIEEYGMRTNLTILLAAAFLLAGCEKARLDQQVKELCVKDGGIKVYETVKLPAERFDQWGMVKPYDPTQKENALGVEYLYRSDDYFYRKGNPSMVRYRHQVFRRSDGKLLGETISYGRGGGDMPGPWEPSSYHCPPTSESSEIALFKKIFVLGEGK